MPLRASSYAVGRVGGGQQPGLEVVAALLPRISVNSFFANKKTLIFNSNLPVFVCAYTAE